MQGMKLVVRGAAVDVLDDTGGVMVVVVGGLAGVTEAMVYELLGAVPSLMAVLVGGVQQGEVQWEVAKGIESRAVMVGTLFLPRW
jgi:hypothetical protein